jgi:hypothetical protein
MTCRAAAGGVGNRGVGSPPSVESDQGVSAARPLIASQPEARTAPPCVRVAFLAVRRVLRVLIAEGRRHDPSLPADQAVQLALERAAEKGAPIDPPGGGKNGQAANDAGARQTCEPHPKKKPDALRASRPRA